MGKMIDPGITPELGETLPPGNYIFRIESLDDSEPTSTGKYMLKATLRVSEPTDHAESPFYENFVIGTDADMEADDPNSWKGIAARRYKDMLAKAGVAWSGNIDEMNTTAAGQLVGGSIRNEVQGPTNRDGSPNRYAGNVQARIGGFFRVGEKAVGESGNGAAPAAAAKPAPVATLKTTPGQPAARPAPAQAAKPQPVPAAAQPIKCGVCDQMVPKAEFAKHVAGHEE